MKNVLKRELIGAEIEVLDAKNKANAGIQGSIIDETKNTLLVETKNGIKRLLKGNITIMLKKEKIKINGSLLIGRPEDRIKKKK